jgi:hypothetical protein
MINYQNGKIYSIRSYQTELIYIGSTTRPLSQRLGEHRIQYKKNSAMSSKEILKYPDYYIELIENFPCNSKEELEKREGYFIKQNINICVNCYIAGRTPKEYNIDNKEQYNEYQKQYHENNKEQKKEYDKQRYLNNAQQLKEHQKQYRLNNKEKIKEQKKQRYQKLKELKQCKQTNNQEPTNNPEQTNNQEPTNNQEQANISEN